MLFAILTQIFGVIFASALPKWSPTVATIGGWVLIPFISHLTEDNFYYRQLCDVWFNIAHVFAMPTVMRVFVFIVDVLRLPAVLGSLLSLRVLAAFYFSFLFWFLVFVLGPIALALSTQRSWVEVLILCAFFPLFSPMVDAIFTLFWSVGVFCVTGDPHRIEHGANALRAAHAFIHALPRSLPVGVQLVYFAPGFAFVNIVRRMVSMPYVIFSEILAATPTQHARGLSYFLLRLILAGVVFWFSLFGIVGTFMLIFLGVAVLLFFLCYWVVGTWSQFFLLALGLVWPIFKLFSIPGTFLQAFFFSREAFVDLIETRSSALLASMGRFFISEHIQGVERVAVPGVVAGFSDSILYGLGDSLLSAFTLLQQGALLFLGALLLLLWLPMKTVRRRVLKPMFDFPFRVLRALAFATLVFLVPSSLFDTFFLVVVKLYEHSLASERSIVRYLRSVLKMLGMGWVVGISFYEDFENVRGGGERNRLSQVFVRSYLSLARRSVLRFLSALNEVRLPEFIQAQYSAPTLTSISQSYQFLSDAGIPVLTGFQDALDASMASPYLAEWASFRDRLLGSTPFRLGYPKKHGYRFSSWIPNDFFPSIPGWINTVTYRDAASEIASTARYWTNPEGEKVDDVEGFNEAVEDLWEVMHRQYEFSRLATFQQVFKKWKKNYNFGFGIGEFRGRAGSNKVRQFTRAAVIQKVGGREAFLKVWADAFKHGAQYQIPSPVFAKVENLKAKKTASRLLRTVIGSSFIHHVFSSVFNMIPDHNLKFMWDQPPKVGMSINGTSFNRIWTALATRKRVLAGDARALDSSYLPYMLRIIAEFRKKGFEWHRDYTKICEIIDIAYDQLRDQPLGFKAFGDIAEKRKGASTGHSATTPDNCLAVVCDYLMAWRAITGLRAREFLHFNTLITYSDDHLIGSDDVFGFTPEKAWEWLRQNNRLFEDEAPGETSLPTLRDTDLTAVKARKMAFLSKKPLPLVPEIRRELLAAGVDISEMSYATCHDHERLVGKYKGMRQYKRKRGATEAEVLRDWQALCSYLALCAHHKDIYDPMSRIANMYYKLNKAILVAAGNKAPKAMSYNEVVYKWYVDSPHKESLDDLPVLQSEEDSEPEMITIIDNPDVLGYIVRWISDFPTLLSPRYSNTRWADWLQNAIPDKLSWPFAVVSGGSLVTDRAVVESLLSRTPYAFLRHPVLKFQPNPPYGVVILRHWVYMFYLNFVVPKRWAFSILDLVRVFDHFVSNMAFVLIGQVVEILVELDLHILDTFMVFALSFLNFDTHIAPLPITVVSPSDLLGQFVSFCFRYISPAGSMDRQALEAAVSEMVFHPGAIRFSAPTGVGKSTIIVDMIQRHLSRPIVVVVPRREVALSVAEYMSSLFPSSRVSSCCEDGTYVPGDRIVYCTVQSYFLHPELRTPRHTLFFDECHIEEPHYNVMHAYVRTLTNRRVIYCTATPSQALLPIRAVLFPSVNSFKVAESTHSCGTFADYAKFVARIINGRARHERSMVFVPSWAVAQKVAALLKYPWCYVSSTDRPPKEVVNTYLVTRVVDAGVTIPDVSFVFSANIDLEVLAPDLTKRTKPTLLYYALSEQVIKQRRGRTGRTCDGIFTLVTLTEEIVNDRIFTYWDYLSAMSSSMAFARKFMPDDILSSVPPEVAYLDPLYAQTPAIWSTAMFVFLKNQILGQSVPEIEEAIAKKLRNPDWGVPKESELMPVHPDADPRGRDIEVDPATIEPVTPVVPKVELPSAQHQAQHPEVWVDVPGVGLLCGAHALRGSIAARLGLNVGADDMVRLIHSVLPRSSDPATFGQILPGAENFFSADTLQVCASLYFGCHLYLTTPERPLSELVSHSPPPAGSVRLDLRLQYAHFNYLASDDQISRVGPELSSAEVDAHVASVFQAHLLIGRLPENPITGDGWFGLEHDPANYGVTYFRLARSFTVPLPLQLLAMLGTPIGTIWPFSLSHPRRGYTLPPRELNLLEFVVLSHLVGAEAFGPHLTDDQLFDLYCHMMDSDVPILEH